MIDVNLFLGCVIFDFFFYIFGFNENELLDLEGMCVVFELLVLMINFYCCEYDLYLKEMSVE